MTVADRPGEGAGWMVPAFPLLRIRLWRIVAPCLLLALAALWSQAASAGVYRCMGPHGEVVFTSHPHDYAHCKAVAVRPQPAISGHAGASVHAPAGAVRAHAAGAPVVLRGSVYRVERGDGRVEYTNVRPAHGRAHKVTRLFTYIDTCVACAVHSPIDWATVPLNLTDYRKAVRAAAAAYGVKPAFLRAVIHAESAFDPNALSSKGAQGLMQLMPATASSMGVADAFNATENIRGGARYLAQLLKDFHGNHKLAAAAYNAGPQVVRKYDGVPPYPQTRVYVKRVGTLYQRYRKALDGRKVAGANPSG